MTPENDSGCQKKKTKTIKRSLNPVWNETIKMYNATYDYFWRIKKIFQGSSTGRQRQEITYRGNSLLRLWPMCDANVSPFEGLGLGQDLSQWLHGCPQFWHEWGPQEPSPCQRLVQTFDTGQSYHTTSVLNIWFPGRGRILQCPGIGRGRGDLWWLADA